MLYDVRMSSLKDKILKEDKKEKVVGKIKKLKKKEEVVEPSTKKKVKKYGKKSK